MVWEIIQALQIISEARLASSPPTATLAPGGTFLQEHGRQSGKNCNPCFPVR
jgi:hypothetical protein